MFLNTDIIEWSFHISRVDGKACLLCGYTFATGMPSLRICLRADKHYLGTATCVVE